MQCIIQNTGNAPLLDIYMVHWALFRQTFLRMQFIKQNVHIRHSITIYFMYFCMANKNSSTQYPPCVAYLCNTVEPCSWMNQSQWRNRLINESMTHKHGHLAPPTGVTIVTGRKSQYKFLHYAVSSQIFCRHDFGFYNRMLNNNQNNSYFCILANPNLIWLQFLQFFIIQSNHDG